MLVDLVQVTTGDGMRLHGALEVPAGDPTARPTGIAASRSGVPDVWICLHGTGSNFYAASTLAGLAPKLLAGGAAVLRANTRGHDLISTGPSASGRTLQGAAFERVDESPLDITAWVNLLRERGYGSIGILGHSLGAIKAIFTLAADNLPGVTALVAVSPPHLSYSHFCASPRAEEFRSTFDQAQQHVAAGRADELLLVRFPLPYYVSAAGFVDRYGPQERYNVLRLLPDVKCPTLVTYGSSEVQSEVAFRGMPEAVAPLATPSNSLQVAVIAGADHLYTGCHDTLAARIQSWLTRRSQTASS